MHDESPERVWFLTQTHWRKRIMGKGALMLKHEMWQRRSFVQAINKYVDPQICPKKSKMSWTHNDVEHAAEIWVKSIPELALCFACAPPPTYSARVLLQKHSLQPTNLKVWVWLIVCTGVSELKRRYSEFLTHIKHASWVRWLRAKRWRCESWLVRDLHTIYTWSP